MAVQPKCSDKPGRECVGGIGMNIVELIRAIGDIEHYSLDEGGNGLKLFVSPSGGILTVTAIEDEVVSVVLNVEVDDDGALISGSVDGDDVGEEEYDLLLLNCNQYLSIMDIEISEVLV